MRGTMPRDVGVAGDAFESFREGVQERYDTLRLATDPNEAEQELIRLVPISARLI